MSADKKDTYQLPTLSHAADEDNDNPSASSYSISIAEEERLPLYSEASSNLPAPTLPDEDASAAQVRAFLYQHLKTRSGLEEALARSISEKWTIGTGAELRTYPFSMFVDVFGAEAAWSIYRSVRGTLLREKEPQRVRTFVIASLVHLSILGSLLIMGFILALTSDDDIGMGAFSCFVISAIVPVVYIGLLADFFSSTPKRVLENELQAGGRHVSSSRGGGGAVGANGQPAGRGI